MGGHLDTTFRGWSSTLAARVRLVISRLVLSFVLPLDFHGRVRVVRSMYLPAALHGIEASFLASESLRKLRSSICRGRVQLGGPWVRRARANAADALDAADIFLYREFSIAPLLDMRRLFKAVMDILDAMIRYGVSLSRSVDLTAQWDQILALGSMYPVTEDDLSVGRGLGIGAFFDFAAGVHRRFCDFIHQVLVNRGDEAVRGRRNWIREDPLVHPYRWLRPDLVPPAPFLQCDPRLTPDGSGVLSDP